MAAPMAVSVAVDDAPPDPSAPLLLQLTTLEVKDNLGIPKLIDADGAGTKDSEKCTLIITEGDSAKAFVMKAGFAKVLSREFYGLYPLKGMFPNVTGMESDAMMNELSNKPQVQNLMKILGLEFRKEYEDVSGLRYGKLMIFVDPDQDGAHILGLLINFFKCCWPSLIKLKFLHRFLTPIVTATYEKSTEVETPIVTASTEKSTEVFFTMPEYNKWQEEMGTETKAYEIEYFKGLATIGRTKGEEYFRNMDRHLVEFVWLSTVDDEIINLLFSRQRTNDRKTWLLSEPEDPTCFGIGCKQRYSDFFNGEYKQWALHKLQRSIASVVDGLKPTQRKIMLYLLENPKANLGVAKMAGCVAERTEYHHALESLEGVIIRMAQEFTSSNNINLLHPDWQFGTRSQGTQLADSRYSTTKLADITRYILHKADDELLTYRTECGVSVEPELYYPVVPMVLINGAEGIGFGYNTFVPNYNPLHVIDNIIRLMDGEELADMDPWYKGFEGVIRKTDTGGYTTEGCFVEYQDGVRITELPIRNYIEKYEEKVLGKELERGKDYLTYKAQEDVVDFKIYMTQEQMDSAKREGGGYLNKFHLSSHLSSGTKNMHLLLPSGKVKKFDTANQILEWFYDHRLELYEQRRPYRIQKLEEDLLKVQNIQKYISLIREGKLKLSRREDPVAEHHKELVAFGFDRIPSTEFGGGTGFEYLVTLSVLTILAADSADYFKNEENLMLEELNMLNSNSAIDLWRGELLALREQLLRDNTYELNMPSSP